MRTTAVQSERTKKSWQEADPEAREAWLAKLREAAKRPDVRERRAAAAREASAQRSAHWTEWVCRKYGLTPEEVPAFRRLRHKFADAGRAARVLRGMREPEKPAGLAPGARQAMARYELTEAEVPVWRAIKSKCRMKAAEAADVVKRSRKAPP